MEKIDVIEQAANRLLQHNVAEARIAIETGYPFHKMTAKGVIIQIKRRWLNLYVMDLLTDIVDRNL